ncbi:MAG: hypothetical protein IJT27_04010, partial [Clostridia bacterium]|nr:hypothetical protein [Clostridia bacterium]
IGYNEAGFPADVHRRFSSISIIYRQNIFCQSRSGKIIFFSVFLSRTPEGKWFYSELRCFSRRAFLFSGGNRRNAGAVRRGRAGKRV